MSITNPKLSDRIRPDVEAAPWVIAEIEKLEQQLAAKQAEVDALMLEYCPSEMSQEQLDNWAAHQRPVEDEFQSDVQAAAGGLTQTPL